ncbi:hypothetical protein BGZ94_004666, partial [Podila epigama]
KEDNKPSMPPPIPAELLSWIVRHLSKGDLARYALVNKQWCSVCIPALWHTIKIHDANTFHHFRTASVQGELNKNAHLIRVLDTRYLGVLRLLFTPNGASVCQYLTMLNLGGGSSSGGLQVYDPIAPIRYQPHHPPPPPPANGVNSILVTDTLPTLPSGAIDFSRPIDIGGDFIPAQLTSEETTYPNPNNVPPSRMGLIASELDLLISLIKSNPRLQSLSFSMQVEHMEALFAVLTSSHLPLLKHLKLRPINSNLYSVMSTVAVKKFFDNLPESLQSLDVYLYLSRLEDQCLEDQCLDKSPCRPHLELSRLTIIGMLGGQEEYILSSFLESCGNNLVQIYTPNSAHLFVDNLYRILEANGSSSEVLDVSEQSMPETSVIRLISKSKAWKTINIRDKWNYTDAVLDAIVNSCSQLENLIITQCDRLSSDNIQRILCRAPNLRVLEAGRTGIMEESAKNPRLQVNDVITSSWICRSLKVFWIDIVGLPRPDIKHGHDGKPVSGPLYSGSTEESRAIQRRVMSQLGALTELTDLCLGSFSMDTDNSNNYIYNDILGRNRYTHSDFQLTCLEMNLAGGLDLLVGLKDLRRLDVTKMAHRIGVPELEWITVKWPKLEELRGLLDDWYEAVEPLRDWLLEHRPKWGAMYLEYLHLFNETGTRWGTMV